MYRRLRITNETGLSNDTRIIDQDSGADLSTRVTSVEITAKVDEIASAKITYITPQIDIVAWAHTPEEEKPLLGLATTRQLLEEVAVRMEVSQNSNRGRELGTLCRLAMDKLSGGVLDYRTVNSD